MMDIKSVVQVTLGVITIMSLYFILSITMIIPSERNAEQLEAKAKLLAEHPERFTLTQARYERDMKKCHTQDDRRFVSHNLMIDSLKVLNNRILELQ